MKKLLVILSMALIICFIVGCQDKEAMADLEEFRAQKEVEEQNKKMEYLAFEKMWNEGKLDVADQIFVPNYISHFGGESYLRRPNEVKKLVSTWLKAFPDFRFKIEDIIAEGDKVAYRLVFKGTHQGEIFGISPT